MTRIIKLLLAVALSVSVANGATLEKVFGLKDQDFAEVTVNKLNKYKISDNLIFGMQMSKVDKFDGYQGKYWNTTFKKPYLKNWVFIEKAWFFANKNQMTFTDENGLELTIRIKKYNVSAGDRITNKDTAYQKQVMIKVLFVNNTYTVYVNDDKLYSSKKRFSKLKSINQKMRYDGIGRNTTDTLIDITLSEIK